MELKYTFMENLSSHVMVVLIFMQYVCSLHSYKIDIQEGIFLKSEILIMANLQDHVYVEGLNVGQTLSSQLSFNLICNLKELRLLYYNLQTRKKILSQEQGVKAEPPYACTRVALALKRVSEISFPRHMCKLTG